MMTAAAQQAVLEWWNTTRAREALDQELMEKKTQLTRLQNAAALAANRLQPHLSGGKCLAIPGTSPILIVFYNNGQFFVRRLEENLDGFTVRIEDRKED